LTKYKTFISKTALKQLNMLERSIRKRIKSAIKQLEISPFEHRPKADIRKLYKLTKHEFYRLRVEKYRIVYSIDGNNVKIVKIFRRGKGYEWLD